jgi:hypothetical protein
VGADLTALPEFNFLFSCGGGDKLESNTLSGSISASELVAGTDSCSSSLLHPSKTMDHDQQRNMHKIYTKLNQCTQRNMKQYEMSTPVHNLSLNEHTGAHLE